MNIIENIECCGLWVGVQICANTNAVCVEVYMCECVQTHILLPLEKSIFEHTALKHTLKHSIS